MTVKLAGHFGEAQVTFHSVEGYSAQVADGHQGPIADRTGKVQVTLVTPWVSVVFSLVIAVIPGREKVFITENNILRERLGIDVMAGLESAALRGLGQNAEVSAKEVAVMATMAKKDLDARELAVLQVARSMESFSASQEVPAEPREEGEDIPDKLIDRSPVMFLSCSEERALRIKALGMVIKAAQRAGMVKKTLDTLTKLVLHTRMLSGER